MSHGQRRHGGQYREHREHRKNNTRQTRPNIPTLAAPGVCGGGGERALVAWVRRCVSFWGVSARRLRWAIGPPCWRSRRWTVWSVGDGACMRWKS